jgi:hypothetical protein
MNAFHLYALTGTINFDNHADVDRFRFDRSPSDVQSAISSLRRQLSCTPQTQEVLENFLEFVYCSWNEFFFAWNKVSAVPWHRRRHDTSLCSGDLSPTLCSAPVLSLLQSFFQRWTNHPILSKVHSADFTDFTAWIRCTIPPVLIPNPDELKVYLVFLFNGLHDICRSSPAPTTDNSTSSPCRDARGPAASAAAPAL